MSFRQRILEQLGLEEAVRVVETASMSPTIRAGESIRFRRESRPPRIGEVWVFEREGVYVAHRVLRARRDGRVLLKGDANPRPDPPIERSQLFGPVSAVLKHGRWVPIGRLGDRTLGVARSLGRSAARRTIAHAARLLPRRRPPVR
jgi:signal peptidase I